MFLTFFLWKILSAVDQVVSNWLSLRNIEVSEAVVDSQSFGLVCGHSSTLCQKPHAIYYSFLLFLHNRNNHLSNDIDYVMIIFLDTIY